MFAAAFERQSVTKHYSPRAEMAPKLGARAAVIALIYDLYKGARRLAHRRGLARSGNQAGAVSKGHRLRW
jgi:hypothetical protein